MTAGGYAALEDELKKRQSVERPRIIEHIAEARSHGDLSENAEYHAAKEEQGLMESRIRKIKEMLRDPEIVEAPAKGDAAGPGMLVTVRPLDEADPDDETYLLAEHAEERAPGVRTVTTTSPFGQALTGAGEGQEVEHEAPGGVFRYVVVSFEPYAG
jgi:transcription elongation factor GreA